VADPRLGGLHHDYRLEPLAACSFCGAQALGHKSIAMTVRYSHLSPDFLQDAVDRLVPQQSEEQQTNRTDTTTDTNAVASLKPHSESVH
jgi:hypothetical protein